MEGYLHSSWLKINASERLKCGKRYEQIQAFPSPGRLVPPAASLALPTPALTTQLPFPLESRLQTHFRRASSPPLAIN